MAKYPTLKRLGICTEVKYSSKIVKILSDISKLTPFFDFNFTKPQKLSLRRHAKISAVTYSNQIEGNTLSETQVERLLKQGKLRKPNHEEKEVKNYSDALEFADILGREEKEIKLSDILDLHKLVMNGLLEKKQIGSLRGIPVSIVNSESKQVIDLCPEPHELKQAMEEFVEWIKDHKNEDPFVRAFSAHFIGVLIHPFLDGNGRTIRILQQLCLLKSKVEVANYVSSESMIIKNKNEYYHAIRVSKKINKIQFFCEYLGTCFLKAMKETIKTNEKKSIGSQGLFTPKDREKMILKEARDLGEFQMCDLQKCISKIPKRTLERDLRRLVKIKKIKAKGKNKGRKYKL